MQLALLSLGLFFLLCFGISFYKVKNGHFFSDVPFGWVFGIFVWGDGLVVFPFWAVVAVLPHFFGVEGVWIYRVVLLFYTVRSVFEVMYWLQKQAEKSTFKPVQLRGVSWLNSEATQIVFQLLHTCVTVTGIALLLASF